MTSGAAQAARLHYWSLTRKRIGSRFLGLDQAGNVLFYPSYRRSAPGGWFPVTLAFQTNRPQTMLMEDGYPMHYRSTQKLQAMFLQRTRERAVLKAEAMKEQIKRELSPQDEAGETSAAASPTSAGMEEEDDITVMQAFLKDCSSPSFLRQHLRVNRLTTALYHALYYGLWLCGGAFALSVYRRFKAWLNPPARNGLENLEAKLMYYPDIVYDALDTYILQTEPFQAAQDWFQETCLLPVKGEVSRVLEPYAVKWAVRHRKAQKAVEDETLRNAEAAEQAAARKVWWQRSMISLLLAIIFVCLL